MNPFTCGTKELDEEFERIAVSLVEQGELSVLLDCIPYKVKQEFIEDYVEAQEEGD